MTLEVVDSFGYRSLPATIQVNVKPNNLPVARISPMVNVDTAPGIFVFNGLSSSDPDGQIITAWSWLFSDGTMASGPTPTKTFSAPGVYTATLRVRDASSGWSDPVSMSVTVLANQPPIVFISMTDDPTNRNRKIFSTANSYDPDGTIGNIVWYRWGEPISGSGPEYAYEFPGPGSYTMGVDVYDNKNLRTQSHFDVTIQAPLPPVARITTTVNKATPFSFSFSGSQSTAETGIARYDWYFSDGTRADGANVTHVFPNDSYYSVRLVITSTDVRYGSTETTVHAMDFTDRAPTAVILGKEDNPDIFDATNPEKIYLDNIPTFVKLSAENSSVAPNSAKNVKYTWDAGPLGSFDGQNVRIRVNREGVFPVTLTLTDDQGRVSQLTTAIESLPGTCSQYESDNICPTISGSPRDVIDATQTTTTFDTNIAIELSPDSLLNGNSVSFEDSLGNDVGLDAIATVSGSKVTLPTQALLELLEGTQEPYHVRIGINAVDGRSSAVGSLRDVRIAKKAVTILVPNDAINLQIIGAASGILISQNTPTGNVFVGALPDDTYTVSAESPLARYAKVVTIDTNFQGTIDLSAPEPLAAPLQTFARNNSTQSLSDELNPLDFIVPTVIPFASHVPGFPKDLFATAPMKSGNFVQAQSVILSNEPRRSICGTPAPFPVILEGAHLMPNDRIFGKLVTNSLSGYTPDSEVFKEASTFTPVAARSIKEKKIAGYCQFQSPTYIENQYYDWLLNENLRCCGTNPTCRAQVTALDRRFREKSHYEASPIKFVAEFSDKLAIPISPEQTGETSLPVFETWSTQTTFNAAAAAMGYNRSTASSTIGLPTNGLVLGWAVPFRFEIPVPSGLVEPVVRVKVESNYPKQLPSDQDFGRHFYYCWIDNGPEDFLVDLKIGATSLAGRPITDTSRQQDNARRSLAQQRLLPVSRDTRSSRNSFPSIDSNWLYSPVFTLKARGDFDHPEFNSLSLSSLIPRVQVDVVGSGTYDVGGSISISNFNCPADGVCVGQFNLEADKIFANVPELQLTNGLLTSLPPNFEGASLRYSVDVVNRGRLRQALNVQQHNLNYDLAPAIVANENSVKLPTAASSYRCDFAYSGTWTTYGTKALLEYTRDVLMHTHRTTSTWLLCNDASSPFGGPLSPHKKGHQIGKNLDIRTFGSDVKFMNDFDNLNAAKKIAAYSLLRAYVQEAMRSGCIIEGTPACRGGTIPTRDFCIRNFDNDTAFTTSGCTRPRLAPSVEAIYSHSNRAQALDDMIKYVKELREGLEPLISKTAKFKALQIRISNGTKNAVPDFSPALTQPTLTEYSEEWNLDFTYHGTIRLGAFSTHLYRNGVHAFKQTNCEGLPAWKMSSNCATVIPETDGSNYDSRPIVFANDANHLNHIHIEVRN